jgi:WhiB family redox-sensing transcriptional regulator
VTDGWLEYAPEELGDGYSVVEFDDADDDEIVPVPVRLRPPAWRARAACASVGWEFMAADETETAARAICESCPVRSECLSFALDTEPAIGIWAGTDFDERCRLCPICQGPKLPDALGCTFAHTLERVSRLIELQAEGDPDVRVSRRTKPSFRTFRYCVLPRGHCHSSANAYKDGCRCAASIAARNEETRRHSRAVAVRGPYSERERYQGRKPKAC